MIIAMMTNIWQHVVDIEVDFRQKNDDDNHTMMMMMMTNRSATSRSIVGSSIGEAETEHKVPTSEKGGQDDDIDCHDYNHDHYHDHYDDHYHDHDHEYHKNQLQRKVARNHDHYGIV